jgi:ABC-type lipoprotein release transport system permease subunit
LPIVDKDNNVIGMISQGDLVAISWYELFQQFKSKTKITFFSYYQLCLLVISLVIYSTIIMLIIRG